MKTLNPKWVDKVNFEISEYVLTHKPIERVESFPLAKSYLISELAKLDISFKIYNLGAGVMKITTNTDTCPCCKRKLP